MFPVHRKATVRKIRKFKIEYLTIAKCFTKIKNENEVAAKVSFWVAHLLAKQGKPSTDGELIKSCLIAEAKEMCPGKINFLKTIRLSPRTAAQKVEDIGSNINSHLKNRANYFKWFSLALYKLTDLNNTPQLLLFIWRVNAEFKAMEELACMDNL